MPLPYDGDEVDKLEDAHRVEHEKGDEPPLFAPAGCMPERIAFEDKNDDEDEAADEADPEESERAQAPGVSVCVIHGDKGVMRIMAQW